MRAAPTSIRRRKERRGSWAKNRAMPVLTYGSRKRFALLLLRWRDRGARRRTRSPEGQAKGLGRHRNRRGGQRVADHLHLEELPAVVEAVDAACPEGEAIDIDMLDRAPVLLERAGSGIDLEDAVVAAAA